MVVDFISDHRVLYVSLTCLRPNHVRKLINVGSLTLINEGSLVLDLDNIDISSEYALMLMCLLNNMMIQCLVF